VQAVPQQTKPARVLQQGAPAPYWLREVEKVSHVNKLFEQAGVPMPPDFWLVVPDVVDKAKEQAPATAATRGGRSKGYSVHVMVPGYIERFHASAGVVSAIMRALPGECRALVHVGYRAPPAATSTRCSPPWSPHGANCRRERQRGRHRQRQQQEPQDDQQQQEQQRHHRRQQVSDGSARVWS
jgi:hypothetical protein